ncbi:MAG TPA: thiolase family protein [Candidatus Dormibacteraeota bacterium]|nr:thiolase family protein [Candidatus Dormibacteraeota bacterium]
MTRGVYILSAVRTPIGGFGGALAELSAADLGVIAVCSALERAFGDPPSERQPYPVAAEALDKVSAKISRLAPTETSDARKTPYGVDELILGNARPAGVGPNLARQVAWRAGLGDEVPAFTVNMACASSLRAILLGWQQILLGEADIIVAAGTESMSRVPYLVEGRWGFRQGHQPLVDAMYRDGFLCPLSNMVMGETAEVLAAQYQIPRDEQDSFALESHQRAARALRECRFAAEIVPVERSDKKGATIRFEKDEHVRPDVTSEALAKLPPVFSKTGTVTAGNSSGITDAAAALVLISETKLREINRQPLARIVDAAVTAVDPRIMGISPVSAVQKLSKRTQWKLEDYDAIELNEAFAAQVLACDRELHFDRARLNPNGGAIALGHPIGCTGARITTTLVHELRRGNSSAGKRGLATLCVSGGLGVALAIETV